MISPKNFVLQTEALRLKRHAGRKKVLDMAPVYLYIVYKLELGAMRRNAFCQVVGIAPFRYDMLRKRGVLPLYLHDEEQERGGLSDYSVGEAFATCVALELQRLGLTLREGSAIINRDPPELPERGSDLIRNDGTPLVYIVADRRVAPSDENVPDSPRLRVATTAWLDRLRDAEVRFSVRGERRRLASVMEKLCSFRLVNLPAIYAAMCARAEAAGISLAPPLD